MINELESFYERLDEEDFINRDLEIDANAVYLEEIDRIKDSNLDLAILLNREREAIQFVKTAEDGLKPRMTGTGKTETGEEVPVEWPDKRNFVLKDYEHIRWRFNTTNNKFLKVEFGLFLFYSSFIKSNDEVLNLLKLLQNLGELYLTKSKTSLTNRYLLDYYQTLKHLLLIANKRKRTNPIGELLQEVCDKVYNEHLNWDFSFDGSMRFILDSTEAIKNYYPNFASFDISKIIDKNWHAAHEEGKSYLWGSIYIADSSYELAKKINDIRYPWRYFTAQQYEKLAEESKANGTLAEVSFIEKALSIYQELKQNQDIERLSQKYQAHRNQLGLGEIRHTLPETESKQIYDNIKRLVQDYSEDEIVLNLCLTPMFNTIDVVREWAEASFKQSILMNFIPVDILDKFGNTIERYNSEEEKKEYAFLQTYNSSFQIASQVFVQFFLEAVKAGKLSDKTIINFLENSWIGQGGVRITNRKEYKISHLALIIPGVKSLFTEIRTWLNDSSYIPDFICSTDSLTLKVEYLLREFCLKTGLVTFKQRKDKQGVVMEKLLDDIIRDLKDYLDENDYYFIKFIMTDKAGENLRNRVAHGLLDNIEYGLTYPIHILSVILKLSNYNFNKEEK